MNKNHMTIDGRTYYFTSTTISYNNEVVFIGTSVTPSTIMAVSMILTSKSK